MPHTPAARPRVKAGAEARLKTLSASRGLCANRRTENARGRGTAPGRTCRGAGGVHVSFSRGLHDTHSVRCMEGTEAVPAATQRPDGKLERRRTRTVQSAAGAVACTRGDLAARSRCSRSSRGQLATLGMGPGRAAGAAGAAAVLLACCCLVGTMMLHGGARTALLGEPFDSNMPGDLSSVRIPKF